MTNRPRVFALALCADAIVCANLYAQDTTAAIAGDPPPRRHVYLLIGQSNMAGRAPIGDEDSGIVERCSLLNDKDEWEPAKNPLNRYSTVRKGLGVQKLGPGYEFAKTILEKDGTLSLGLVVNAKGGTSIKEWAKGSAFYNEALRRSQKARETGELKGILWHQGESDSGDDTYLEKLTALIADLRHDLGEPNLPFVAGQVFYHPETKANTKRINEQLAKLPGAVPFTGCVMSEGLTTIDNTHFDAESVRLLGRRYAEEMLRIRLPVPPEKGL